MVRFSELPSGAFFRFGEAPALVWQKTRIGVVVDGAWRMFQPEEDVICIPVESPTPKQAELFGAEQT